MEVFGRTVNKLSCRVLVAYIANSYNVAWAVDSLLMHCRCEENVLVPIPI